jgi:hypothetical protein
MMLVARYRSHTSAAIRAGHGFWNVVRSRILEGERVSWNEANRQQRHVHDLGIANFRVLTVTTSTDRVERMLAALDGITNGRGSNMFLFTDQAAITGSYPLDLEWVSGKREAGSGAADGLIVTPRRLRQRCQASKRSF